MYCLLYSVYTVLFTVLNNKTRDLTGLMQWRFFKRDGGINSRLVKLCDQLDKSMPNPDVPHLPIQGAVSLCHSLSTDYAWLKDTFGGQREPWVESLGKASDRLMKMSEKTVLAEVSVIVASEGKDKGLSWLTSLPHLPGDLPHCKALLVDHDLLVKLTKAQVPEDLNDLSKELSILATLSCYSKDLLQGVFGRDVAKSISAYFSAVYESMDIAIASVEKDMVEWQELVAKYRPGNRRKKAHRLRVLHFSYSLPVTFIFASENCNLGRSKWTVKVIAWHVFFFPHDISDKCAGQPWMQPRHGSKRKLMACNGCSAVTNLWMQRHGRW